MYGSPGYADLEPVEAYLEVHEILRDRRFIAGRSRPEGREFLGETMVGIDGDRHLVRRRLYAPLMSEENLTRLERELVEPMLAATVGTPSSGSDSSCTTIDLVPLARDLCMRVAAAILGIEGVQSPSGTERLTELLRPIAAGATVEWSPRDHAEVIAEGRAAKAAFVEEFFAPAWERRGRADAEQPDRDLISIMARSREALGGDPDLPVRESILFLAAATGNPVGHLAFAVDDLLAWAETESVSRIPADDDFLRGAINETLRLHITGTPVLVRECTEPVELRSTGRHFDAGALLGLDMVAANRDPDVFGPDADRFDPHRSGRITQRAKSYGVAFGGGPHICLGRALVLGRDSGVQIDGLQFGLLSRLLRQGIHRDPQRSPALAASGQRHYESFPVHLAAESGLSHRPCA